MSEFEKDPELEALSSELEQAAERTEQAADEAAGSIAAEVDETVNTDYEPDTDDGEPDDDDETVDDDDDEDEDEATDDTIDPDNPLPNGSFFDHRKEEKRQNYPYPVLVTLLYLVLGFVFHLWHPGWLIFLTVPLYYLPGEERKFPRILCNPVMVTLIYLLLGFYCHL